MKNSKLIDVLKGFENQEILNLKKFFNSTYFINRETLADFANLLLDQYPMFDASFIDEKEMYKILYPGKRFQIKTIYKLMGQMMSQIHTYLAVENFLHDQKEVTLRKLEELRKKGITNEFLRIGKRMNDEFLFNKKNQLSYYNLMRYENELALYYNLSKEHLGYSKYLNNQSLTLDIYFIYAKLKLSCEMINRQKSFSTVYDLSFLEQVIKYVEANPEKFETVPAINIYIKIISTLIEPGEQAHYKALVLLLEDVKDSVDNEELRDMYGFAQNYCISSINNGQFEYVRELFSLYGKLLDNKVIYENNILSQWDYKNITTIGLRLKEYDWTENFLKSNKERIQHNFRDVSYWYNLANLFYEKKDFATAIKNLNLFNDSLKHISDPEFDDIFYNLDSRTMFLKIYYELEEDDTFGSTIETFKSYLIRNKKISELQKKIYLNLLKYSKKLSNQRQRFRLQSGQLKSVRFNVKRIKKEISTDKNIVNLSWLQARVEELEKEVG